MKKVNVTILYFLSLILLTLIPWISAEGSVRFEAEDGVLTGVRISTSAAGFSGSGYVTGFYSSSDNVTWTFTVEPGLYRIKVGFRSNNGEKGYNLTVNGSVMSGMFPYTSTFSRDDAGLLLLDDSLQTVSIGGGWNWYDIDYIELIPSDPIPPPQPVNPVPVDPLATPESRRLLAYLACQYGKVTLSGQQELPESFRLESEINAFPAIITGDLIDYSPTRVAHGSYPGGYTENFISTVRDKHCILSVMWHWNAPAELIDSQDYPWWWGFYTNGTTFNLAEVLANPDGAYYQLLLRDIDTIAVQLKKIQNAGIPVLWRPLHEAEGGWFWWGAQGAQPLVELWRLLYDRLTDYHDIHNLLWVYTIENPDNREWYPGDAYVDIVGRDAYPQDMEDTLTSTWEAMLQEYDGRKIIALTEFGGVPAVDKMQAYGVWWSYFSSWQGDLGPFSSNLSRDRLRSIYLSDEVGIQRELRSPTGNENNLGPSSAIPVLLSGNKLAVKVTFSEQGIGNSLFSSTDLTHWVEEKWPVSPEASGDDNYLLPLYDDSLSQCYWRIAE